MPTQTKWTLTGDYFENCNCDVVCPCLVSPAAPLTAKPTRDVCDVALVFHIDRGKYGDLALDGLNVAVIAHTPGAMGAGNWTAAAYIDERATEAQAAALGTIFTGAEGGPMAAFAPLIGKMLDPRKVPITYTVTGNSRAVTIPGIMQMAVEPVGSMHPSGEIWGALGHPVAPDRMAMAVGSKGSTYTDHGMRWDNSGRNGHYAPIAWSN
ncbi:MAG: DUF1326 domain-containing protein [Acetobacteraceae bacterium]|nr:DUF1326 domain-containing protein [Acetobacteraceae bacterium]